MIPPHGDDTQNKNHKFPGSSILALPIHVSKAEPQVIADLFFGNGICRKIEI
jgi:hypothetical protein